MYAVSIRCSAREIAVADKLLVRPSHLRVDEKRRPCYKFPMKIIEQWLLFKYVDGQLTPLSKPFNTKAAAEKARLELPEREQRKVAVGVARNKR
jgi:hypothetical protein